MKKLIFYFLLSKVLLASTTSHTQTTLDYFTLEKVAMDSTDIENFIGIEIDTIQIGQFNIPRVIFEKELKYYSEEQLDLFLDIEPDIFILQLSSLFDDKSLQKVIYKNQCFKLTPMYRELFCFEVEYSDDSIPIGGRPINRQCPLYFDFYDNGNIKFRCVGDFYGYTLALRYSEFGYVTKLEFYKSNEVFKEITLYPESK